VSTQSAVSSAAGAKNLLLAIPFPAPNRQARLRPVDRMRMLLAGSRYFKQ